MGVSLLDDHYDAAVARRGYDPIGAPDGRDVPDLHRRFAFADGPDVLGTATADGTVASIGISLTGPPHVGTLGQIRTAIDLQAAGADVQLVLADLVVAATRGTDFETLADRAERYAALAETMGFDAERGRCYVQGNSPGVVRTAVRVARGYDPSVGAHGEWAEPTAFEEALAAAYDSRGPGIESADFADDLAGLWLAADTLRPILESDADCVVLVLGADNVGMARAIGDHRARCGIDGSVIGLYTKLVRGVDGTPKMSKSLPGSTLDLGMPPEEIRDIVRTVALESEHPPGSVVRGMMDLASPFSPSRLGELREVTRRNDERWTAAVEEYAGHLVELAESWQCDPAARP